MVEYSPPFASRSFPVGFAQAAVIGGRLVSVARMHANPGDTVLGIAARDVAPGADLSVHRGAIQILRGPAVIAGQPLKAGADGFAAVWVPGTDAANLHIADAIEAMSVGNPFKVVWR